MRVFWSNMFNPLSRWFLARFSSAFHVSRKGEPIRRKQPPRVQLLAERLEERINPNTTLLPLIGEQPFGQLPVTALDRGPLEPTVYAVVFFESAVADYQVLRQGLSAGTDAVVLDSGGDGLRQMAAVLAGRHDLTSIGVVAHGAPGAVALGTATLDAQNVKGYARELVVIGSALGSCGELDLWSCDVAAGQCAATLVQDIATATGAGVAASDHAVGSPARGGNRQFGRPASRGARGISRSPLAAARGGFHELLGTWSAAASMAATRDGATATLLPSGQVLVTGGYNGNVLSSAELYSPVSNTWSVAASMATARHFQTATLLDNGKVLVAGGDDGNNILSSAELYDPASNTWSAAASWPRARVGATATLLDNGKVLLAGGYSGTKFLSSAELYDSVSNTLVFRRLYGHTRGTNHTATLLGNGQVLLAGGYDGTKFLSSAELYDSVSNTWSAAASRMGASQRHGDAAGQRPSATQPRAGNHGGQRPSIPIQCGAVRPGQ